MQRTRVVLLPRARVGHDTHHGDPGRYDAESSWVRVASCRIGRSCPSPHIIPIRRVVCSNVYLNEEESPPGPAPTTHS